MTNFYERQLKRMFGDSEVLSADTVFAGKAMVSKISADLRAKIEFVTARVSGQYEGLKLSIINKNEGLIDSQTFMFHEIIGLKGTARDRKPHVWDDNGKASWFGYEPTASEFENIASKVEDYVEMYKALDVQVHREHYCKKADTRFLDEMNHKRPRSMDELESIWYNGRGGRWSHYDDTRYHGLNLHSVFSKGTIEFRLFNSTLHAGRVKTYIQLCLAISNQALHQKGASRSKTQSPNEKYTFRTWLLRLGMIGDEFKTARGFLLEKLEGNIAWRDPAQAEAQKERFAARRLAEQEAPTEEEPSDAVQDDDTDQDEEPAIRITM